MNTIEKALIHGLFIHLHHNIDKVIDFSMFKDLNDAVAKTSTGELVLGPDANDDAAVFRLPGDDNLVAAKMESHCSPCVPRPYDGAATGAGGAMRDVVAMGARPLFLLDFIGTKPMEEEVLVGTCGFDGECTCGECKTMTSGERLSIMVEGLRDMCQTMNVFVVGGGLSTSIKGIVPAVVVTVIGRLVVDEPLTKPAKDAGDHFILLGETNDDGNDTLYRAGLADTMRPAEALFEEEKAVMEAALAIIKTNKVKSCSDLGAAGIGAAAAESVRFGGLGAEINLAKAPLKKQDLTPEEILICETQARMMFQVDPIDVKAVLKTASDLGVAAADIGEVTDGSESVFMYKNKEIARIPNSLPADFEK